MVARQTTVVGRYAKDETEEPWAHGTRGVVPVEVTVEPQKDVVRHVFEVTRRDAQTTERTPHVVEFHVEELPKGRLLHNRALQRRLKSFTPHQ